MERFARLYQRLDATTSTTAKVEAMRAYFAGAPPEDAAWAVLLLSGGRLQRVVGPRKIAGWALERSGISEWLFGECYAAVGDLAEAIALIVPEPAPEPESEPEPTPEPAPEPEPVPEPEPRIARVRAVPPLHRLAASIESLRDAAPEAQRSAVLALLDELRGTARMLAIKLLTGELRVGVSGLLLTRALAAASGLSVPTLAHRLVGTFVPTADAYRALVSPEVTLERDPKKPYPFMLASPLDAEPATLGDPASLCIEWKWDGIRCQLLRRGGETFLWSRGEELVTERFPEIVEASRALPDGTVLDGEAMCWRGEAPLPFAILQRRIGRKRLTPRVLGEAPVVFVAYDLLELDHDDLRARPLSDRRARLEALLADPPPSLRLSPRIAEPSDWPGLTALRATSRERGVEGFMLKRWDAPYGVGRKRGDAWKWKIQPFTVDAVLVYAHPGHGRRSNLFTDYTFAVWDQGALVPIARAYSGLDEAEITELDRWIRAHVKERFGPVRAVDPQHVFELAFEGIAVSTRHKAGLALRFPRIARWRRDKRPVDADRIEALRALIPGA